MCGDTCTPTSKKCLLATWCLMQALMRTRKQSNSFSANVQGLGAGYSEQGQCCHNIVNKEEDNTQGTLRKSGKIGGG